MSNSVVNVFSKQARFQDLGPIPSNARDLWGWPIIKDFLSIVNFQAGHLCPILWSTFSRNRRGFRTCDQFHRIQGTCKGGQSQRIFFLSLIFMLENMCNSVVNVFSKQARFQDLGPIPSNAGDLWGWPIIKDFLSVVNFLAGNLCQILWSTFSRNRRGFRTWDQFHRIRGTCKGGGGGQGCF